MNQNVVAGYSLDQYNNISTFRDRFTGKCDEPVDKIYFRQKDELNQYSEAYFRSKSILQRGGASQL